ncbi:hypothetical protein PZB74_02855 [Porifericola rhodea]|uniref:hypothetical protein n=1 Tax=Porifericola rhodea TaxID=930972 RepID=UPI00266617C2|nr:hypothetical protein [Porifericola rhodea]WKN32292.1 hypothetical protein PZB74_02855 [Porifericola rhodea]
MKNTIWLSLLFFLFAACTSRINRQKEDQLTEEQFDSLRTVYYGLNDSLAQSWAVMMEDDDKKLTNLQLLIDEIRRADYYGADTLDSLELMVDMLKDLRYDSVSVANSMLIDSYDSANDVVSNTIIDYVDDMQADAVSPMISVLRDQIVNSNNSILLYRIRYDRFSEDFNIFLEKYKNVMSTIDSSGGPVYKRPMFRLVNDFREEDN